MVAASRPQWTRASIGIPIDTVVRIHGGSAGESAQRGACIPACAVVAHAGSGWQHAPEGPAWLSTCARVVCPMAQVLDRIFRHHGTGSHSCAQGRCNPGREEHASAACACVCCQWCIWI